ncbi:uncharacterized protein DMAD_08927 [Drosophila madeirensis]|uniref:Uncharacterized protein n=1 Tax=Drosophila madeirensis TaxID=30013 RepID=A0AAU9F5U3_DROMD
MSLVAFVGRLVRRSFVPPSLLQLSGNRGPRKIPHMPIKGPRDYDYWRELKRERTPKPSRKVGKRIPKKSQKFRKIERETERKR